MDSATRRQLIAVITCGIALVLGAWWAQSRGGRRKFTATRIVWRPGVGLQIYVKEPLDTGFATKAARLRSFTPAAGVSDIAVRAAHALATYPDFVIKAVDTAAGAITVGSTPAGFDVTPALSIDGAGALEVRV